MIVEEPQGAHHIRVIEGCPGDAAIVPAAKGGVPAAKGEVPAAKGGKIIPSVLIARSGAGKYRTGRRTVLTALAATILLFGVGLRAAPAAEPVTILAFGDSLISGYGLPEAEGFPAQLQRALEAAGVAARVANAGVAGDTSAGGLARLDWALGDGPDLVILEFGANDGLRGLDPAGTERNLDAMLARLATKKIPVLFAGMHAPRNLGADYAAQFDALYPRLAGKHRVRFDPFFLEGVATDPALNQADGIHPNAAGVAKIVERLLPTLRAMIDALPAAQG